MASANQSTSEILRLFPRVPVDVPSSQSTLKRAASRTQPYPKDVQLPCGRANDYIARQHELETASSSIQASSTASRIQSHNLLPEQWQILDQVCDKFSEVPLGVIMTTLELLRSRAAGKQRAHVIRKHRKSTNFIFQHLKAASRMQSPHLGNKEVSIVFTLQAQRFTKSQPFQTTTCIQWTYSNASLSTASSNRPASLFSFVSNPSSRSSLHEETGQGASGRYVEQVNSQKRKTSHGEDVASSWSSRKQLNQESPIEQTSSDAKYYFCPDCFKPFTSKSSVTRHQDEVHHNHAGYSCPPAGLTSMTNSGAECALCSKPSPDVEHFLTVHHFADCHNKAELGSPRCFKRRSDFAKHMETHGVDKDSSAFNRWARNSKNKGAWGCGFCISTHYTWPTYQQHLQDHVRADPFCLGWDHSMVIKGLLSQPFLSKALAYLLGGSTDRLLRNPSLTWSEAISDALQAKLEERRESARAAACAQSLVREAFELINTNKPQSAALFATIPGATGDLQHDFYDVQPAWGGQDLLDFNMDSPTLPPHVFGFTQDMDNFRLDDSTFEGPAKMFNHSSVWESSIPPPQLGGFHVDEIVNEMT
ncbi:hypothetical protein MMC17_004938 [Xylographa soralifera]|nr:hypothetical protein [Xylographa soralifera]